MYKILPDERSLAAYLKSSIMEKLLSDQHVDQVSYEQVLLLRLSCDVAKNSKN